MDDVAVPGPTDAMVAAFWERARFHAKLNTLPGYFGPTPVESVPPPVWSFGATPAEADELLGLVLDGVKTATSSALADYEVAEEPLPAAGTLGILTDGQGRPRALVATTRVDVVPFDAVDADHARREGEGDRTLEAWRATHRAYFSEHATGGFREDMPVVLERFEVLHRSTD